MFWPTRTSGPPRARPSPSRQLALLDLGRDREGDEAEQQPATSEDQDPSQPGTLAPAILESRSRNPPRPAPPKAGEARACGSDPGDLAAIGRRGTAASRGRPPSAASHRRQARLLLGALWSLAPGHLPAGAAIDRVLGLLRGPCLPGFSGRSEPPDRLGGRSSPCGDMGYHTTHASAGPPLEPVPRSTHARLRTGSGCP